MRIRMTEMTFTPAGSRPPVSAPAFVATILGIVAAIALLLLLDLFLAGIDARESAARAESEYAAGQVLLAAGHPGDAIAHFSAAAAIDRQNASFALGLGESFLDAGKNDEAESTLRALLQRVENDGAVNLAMAEVMERQGRLVEAKAFFHRANFGRWGADSVERRTRARFELIDLLTHQGSTTELLTELLPLQEISTDSPSVRVRLGQLFVLAGAPRRATTVFQEVLSSDPQNADAQAGIGQAALSLGNFTTAKADLAEAARLKPGDSTISRSLAIADSALSLDPTARGLESSDRVVRSRKLLERTLATVGACSWPRRAAALTTARAALSAGLATQADDGSGDAMIAAASDLWALRPLSCAAVQRDALLRFLHARLAT
jgi:tetratricopeptide (TPR) repeat protein